MTTFKLVPANQGDYEELLALRLEAMRTSLEALSRFDPAKSRGRFAESFVLGQTRHIVQSGSRVGFVAVRPEANGWLLDHLYLSPSAQGKGLGALVLQQVFAEVDAQSLSLRVGALKGSASNRFYARHGFVLVEKSRIRQLLHASGAACSLTHGSSGLAPFGCAGPSFHYLISHEAQPAPRRAEQSPRSTPRIPRETLTSDAVYEARSKFESTQLSFMTNQVSLWARRSQMKRAAQPKR